MKIPYRHCVLDSTVTEAEEGRPLCSAWHPTHKLLAQFIISRLDRNPIYVKSLTLTQAQPRTFIPEVNPCPANEKPAKLMAIMQVLDDCRCTVTDVGSYIGTLLSPPCFATTFVQPFFWRGRAMLKRTYSTTTALLTYIMLCSTACTLQASFFIGLSL